MLTHPKRTKSQFILFPPCIKILLKNVQTSHASQFTVLTHRQTLYYSSHKNSTDIVKLSYCPCSHVLSFLTWDLPNSSWLGNMVSHLPRSHLKTARSLKTQIDRVVRVTRNKYLATKARCRAKYSYLWESDWRRLFCDFYVCSHEICQ